MSLITFYAAFILLSEINSIDATLYYFSCLAINGIDPCPFEVEPIYFYSSAIDKFLVFNEDIIIMDQDDKLPFNPKPFLDTVAINDMHLGMSVGHLPLQSYNDRNYYYFPVPFSNQPQHEIIEKPIHSERFEPVITINQEMQKPIQSNSNDQNQTKKKKNGRRRGSYFGSKPYEIRPAGQTRHKQT